MKKVADAVCTKKQTPAFGTLCIALHRPLRSHAGSRFPIRHRLNTLKLTFMDSPYVNSWPLFDSCQVFTISAICAACRAKAGTFWEVQNRKWCPSKCPRRNHSVQ